MAFPKGAIIATVAITVIVGGLGAATWAIRRLAVQRAVLAVRRVDEYWKADPVFYGPRYTEAEGAIGDISGLPESAQLKTCLLDVRSSREYYLLEMTSTETAKTTPPKMAGAVAENIKKMGDLRAQMRASATACLARFN